MLHLCRPSGTANTSAQIARSLQQRCRQAVMVMLRKALKTQARAQDADDIDATDFANVPQNLSGFDYSSFPVLKVDQGSSGILLDFC